LLALLANRAPGRVYAAKALGIAPKQENAKIPARHNSEQGFLLSRGFRLLAAISSKQGYLSA